MQFLVVVGLRSKFPFWLLAGSGSQPLEATTFPGLWAASSESRLRHALNLSDLPFCLILLTSLPSGRQFSAFKHSCD